MAANAAASPARIRSPLLMIAGEKDHIIPAALNQKNFARYQGPSVTELHTFSGRDHWIIASDGWQEVADYVRGWIEKGQAAAGGAQR